MNAPTYAPAALQTNADARYGSHHLHVECLSNGQADNIAAMCGDDLAGLPGIEELSREAREHLVGTVQEKRGLHHRGCRAVREAAVDEGAPARRTDSQSPLSKVSP